jgi:hypothetical protein
LEVVISLGEEDRSPELIEYDLQEIGGIIAVLIFILAIAEFFFIGDIFPFVEPSFTSGDFLLRKFQYCCCLVPMVAMGVGISSMFIQRKIFTGKWKWPDRSHEAARDKEAFWEEMEKDPTVVVSRGGLSGGRSYRHGGACERCHWERPWKMDRPFPPTVSFSFCYDCKKIICGSCRVVEINLGMPPEVASRISSYGREAMTATGGICKDCYSEHNRP